MISLALPLKDTISVQKQFLESGSQRCSRLGGDLNELLTMAGQLNRDRSCIVSRDDMVALVPPDGIHCPKRP